MKILYKVSIAVLVLPFLFGILGPITVSAATTPSLGAAANFGILGYTYTNNSTFTSVTGDLGYTVGPSTAPSVSGATHVNDTTYVQAVSDQNTALSSLNGWPCTTTFPTGTVDLATDSTHGTVGVYTPGVYCIAGSMTIAGGGTVTLSGAGTYIFRPTGTLTTSDNSVVTGTNGVSACDIFWTPGGNTTLGAVTNFAGTVIEPLTAVVMSITVGAHTNWGGRALNGTNGTGAVVTTGVDDTISVLTCGTPATGTLHVIKHVINDNSGTATASSFNVHVKGSGSMGVSDVAGSPAVGSETPGTSYSLMPNTYTVSEDVNSGYTASFSGDCDANGNISLVSGDSKTCTITNDDIAAIKIPPADGGTGTLHVIKTVINDNGGKAVASDAVVHVINGLGDVSGSPHVGVNSPGTAYTLSAGTYNVSENFFLGYTMTIRGDCAVNGDVVLASGDNKTCTITNNDIATIPPSTTVTPPPATTTSTVPVNCDICSRLTYDVYIINPDGSQRHTGTPWVKVTDRGNGVKRYSFEDTTLDPNNPLFDHNDSIIDVDYKDCKSVNFMFASSDASWKHQVRIKVSIDGIMQSDTLVSNDSKAVVGTSKLVNATTGVNTNLACLTAPAALKGKILLQIQQHGEAWYIRPSSGLRYYMKDGTVAYSMMRNFGLGITDKNLTAIPSVQTIDELKSSASVCSTNSSANKIKGSILLQVQQHGEAWYVDVGKCRSIYRKDGAAAYSLMRFLGLGITDADLAKLPIGQ